MRIDLSHRCPSRGNGSGTSLPPGPSGAGPSAQLDPGNDSTYAMPIDAWELGISVTSLQADVLHTRAHVFFPFV